MIFTVLMLLASIAPSNKTSWMRPELFHLIIGMPREQAVKTLEQNGWKPKRGDHENEVIVDYSDERTLKLQFRRDRLNALDFELFALLPEAKTAFVEQREALAAKLGAPRKALPSILVYDDRLPNVMVVLSADPKSEQGRRGLGMLVVRYYDPR